MAIEGLFKILIWIVPYKRLPTPDLKYVLVLLGNKHLLNSEVNFNI